MLNSLGTAMHAKYNVAAYTFCTYGLGCQQLGPTYYAYSSYNTVHGCFDWLGLHPAQDLFFMV